MNGKINDKQRSDDRTMEEQNERRPALDKNKFLTNCLTVALTKFFADENFLLYSREVRHSLDFFKS